MPKQSRKKRQYGGDNSEDIRIRAIAKEEGPELFTKFLSERRNNGRAASYDKIRALFNDDGEPNDGVLTATTFNDLYKWTMMPVIRYLEKHNRDGSNRTEPITVTFGVDLRDEGMRKAMRKEANTLSGDEQPEYPESNEDDIKQPLLFKMQKAIESLKVREFNPDIFKSVNGMYEKGELLSTSDIDAICKQDGALRKLVQHVTPYKTYKVGESINNYTDENRANGDVVVSFYYISDLTYNGETGVHFIEATGPWHRVTWLETSLMQCIYEAKLRFDLNNNGILYNEWLADALKRCAKSVVYTREIQKKSGKSGKMNSALFTGRRTGGFLFLLLQNLFMSINCNGLGQAKCIGTSSVDSWYKLKTLGICLPPACLSPVGTHAHELSMVTSALFPVIDNNEHNLPLTQIVGHYLYYLLVANRLSLPMPMLPDTLGTRAFMKAAHYLTYNEQPFINIIGGARQDSGSLKDFMDNMADFKYTKPVMASEIDTTDTLLKASELGYSTFGAGGFFGDSIKVWEKDSPITSNSMAAKAVRVERSLESGENVEGIPYMKTIGADKVIGYPVKIGDSNDRTIPKLSEGKLSLDKSLDKDTISAIRSYASNVREKAWTEKEIPGPIDINTIITFNLEPAKGGYRRKMRSRRHKRVFRNKSQKKRR